MLRRLLVLTLVLSLTWLGGTAAQASPITYKAILSGPNEAPPNESPGSGLAFVTFDLDAHTLEVYATFADLIGVTTSAHIHAPTAAAFAGTAGVATQTPSFSGFPLGVRSGTFYNSFDMTLESSYNPSYLNNATNLGNLLTAEASLALAAADGKAYFNVHSSFAPGGEIRGFLAPVPEPGSSLLLLSMGLVGLRAWRKRLG